jgi:gluconolactonase
MSWKFQLVHGPLGRPLGGMAWDGNAMLVSDIEESVILRCDPATNAVSPSRKYTNHTNGIALGADRVLYGCQSGSRRIVRFMPDGSANVLATRLDGHVHNNPYFLAVDAQERIWFSDLEQIALRAGPAPQRFAPLPHQSILRLSRGRASDWRLECVTHDTKAPTGVAVSPDGNTLYVAEGNSAPHTASELRAYPIKKEGTLGAYTVLHTFDTGDRGIEGMCVDAEGNIIACAGWRRCGRGPLVYVFSPTGIVLETHAVPADLPFNCAFGGEGLTSLFVTTLDGHLFRTEAGGRRGCTHRRRSV